MPNINAKANSVSLNHYLSNPSIVYGFKSYYDDEPFDYTIECTGYEIGRQIAVIAKAKGYSRSQFLCRRPHINELYFINTPILASIVYMDLGYGVHSLAASNRSGRIAQ